MSRIRTVKPDLFRHEELFEAELESGLPLRLAFIGLFTVADCMGRFRWKPRTLKLDVLPHDACDFSAVLAALEHAGFVRRYTVDGQVFGVIPSFIKHQQITGREAERGSFLPEPPSVLTDPVPVLDRASTGTRQDQSQASTAPVPDLQEEEEEEEGKRKGRGREGEKEEEGTRARKTPAALISPDWRPGQQALTILQQQGIPETFAKDCIPEFILYWTERGEARPGWDASFVNSVRRTWDKSKDNGKGGAPPKTKSDRIADQSSRAIAEWLARDRPPIEGEVNHVAH